MFFATAVPALGTNNGDHCEQHEKWCQLHNKRNHADTNEKSCIDPMLKVVIYSNRAVSVDYSVL